MSGNTFMKIIHLWVDCESFPGKRVWEEERYVTQTVVCDFKMINKLAPISDNVSKYG